MGRPSLGAAARTVLLATKGTASERDQLVAKYGSVYAGMRFALRLALADEAIKRATELEVRTEAADAATGMRGVSVDAVYIDEAHQMDHDVVEERNLNGETFITSRPRQSGKTKKTTEQVEVHRAEHPDANITQTHKHRRGKELDPIYEQGTKKRRYTCSVEGCQEVLS